MIEFGVLGPLTLRRDGQPQVVSTKILRRTLALLLSRAGALVPADFIIDTVWLGSPPPTARRTLSVYMSRMRQLLGDDDRIECQGGAYAICPRLDELDTLTFERLARQAADERAGGRPESAWSTLRSALSIWRGPAYAELLDLAPLAAAASRLEELRLALVEERMQLGLDSGHHAEVVVELSQMVTDYPYRERLRGQQMLALYRSGRQAEALDAYRLTYHQLTTDLGVEPGVELRRLQQLILAGDPGLATPPASWAPVELTSAPAGRPEACAVPAQLPLDVRGFTGRDDQLAALGEILTPASAAGSPVALVTGTAGVGKSALIVHWAHRVREQFPDGQLYADLRGYSAGTPAQPLEILARFLRACGTPADCVPVDVDDAAAVYRTLLAERRMLVVLDNAGCADQVRPLLPGGQNCAVAVTSRDRLDGLVAKDGARRLDLGVLRPAEVPALLASVIGADQLEEQGDAAAELAMLCGYLPLALRIAAATIAGEHAGAIGGYVTRLRSGDRLSALSIDSDPGSAVRGAFDASYRCLGSAAKRLFRLLGLIPGTDLDAHGTSALAGISQDEAATALRRLAAAHLVEERGQDRYGLHDLLRLYAFERACAEDDPDQRTAAIGRLLSWYLGTAIDATRRLYGAEGCPHATAATGGRIFASDGEAIAWLNAERVSLVAAVSLANDLGLGSTGWRLSGTLQPYFWHTRYLADWAGVARAGLIAASADGDPLAIARMRVNLGLVTSCRYQYDEAVSHYTAALESATSAGWLSGQQSCLTNVGNLHITTGDLSTASSYHGRALALARRRAHPRHEGVALTNLGIVAYQLGELERAEAHQRAALLLYRQPGVAGDEAIALQFLGLSRHALGDPAEALSHLTRALEIVSRTGSRLGIGHTLMDIADVHRAAGRYVQAAESVDAALTVLRATGNLESEALALNVRGRLRLHTHGAKDAAADHAAALEAARRMRGRYAEADSLAGLAAAWALTRPGEAIKHAEAALSIAGQAEFRLLAGQALTAKAAALAAQGDQVADRGPLHHVSSPSTVSSASAK